MSRIIIKNSRVSGSVPSSLLEGELAINVIDGKLYYGDGSTVKLLSGSGGGGGGGTGTVTSVGFTAGTGISLGGTNPITTAGTITITNSAPDQTVVLNSGTGISVTGTYPTFTIASTVSTSGFLTTSSFNSWTGSSSSQFAGTASYSSTASFAPAYVPIGSTGTTSTISGSLIINQNLTVLGTQSVQYITSSQLDISTNIITVNTANPAVRFGGLAVIDSGSSPLVSASFLYDSVQDEFLFVHKGTAGGALTSSVFLLGPETFNNVGNETYLTQNRIPKGTGIEHLNDSNISDNGSVVSINSNTQVTGSLNVSGVITGSFSGSVVGYVPNSQTSSFVQNSQTGSFATTGSNNFVGNQTITGSLVISGSGVQAPLQVWSGSTSLLFVSSSGVIGISNSTPTSRLQLNFNQNSVTQNDNNGFLLANATAATVGLQSISPGLVWQGNGWKTTATAASQDVRFRADVLPVQGTTSPTATWQLASSINGGAYSNALTYTSNGQLTANTITVNSLLNGNAVLTLGTNSQFSATNGTTTTNKYRTTNGGIDVSPPFWLSNTVAITAGDLAITSDATNGLSFTVGNGSRAIARAAIQVSGSNNITGSEAGDLLFLTQAGGTAMSEKMRITSGGRVGIGITPVTQFQVNLTNTDFTNTAGSGSHFLMTNPSATGQNVVASFINGSLVAKWRTDYVGNISWVAGSTGAHDFYTGGDFGAGSIKMRVFNGGNVQIATSPVGGANADAGFKLDVQGTTRASGSLTATSTIGVAGTLAASGLTETRGINVLTSPQVSNGLFSYYYYLTNNGSLTGADRTISINANATAPGNNQLWMGLAVGYSFSRSNSSATPIIRASIQATNYVDTAASESADMIFLTKPGSPANTAMTERMRITSTGNVAIGKTTANATLDVTGSVIITGSLTVFTGSAIEFQVTDTGVRIGNASTDVHPITGSVGITGSITLTGNITVASGSLTVTSGSITMPTRPAFRVYGASVTGIPTPTTISGSATVVDYNQGNNYNNTTGVFTAPIAGLYSVYYNGRTNSGATQQVIVYKNSLTSSLMWESTGSFNGHFGVSSILSLAVNDTLRATVTVGTIQFDNNDNWGAAYIG